MARLSLKKLHKDFEKKISKTREARTGPGIYKKRNRRDYRVIMNLITYKRIIEEDPQQLKFYSGGYAVRLKANEYFSDDGNKKEDFPDSLKLGKNAFIFFKILRDWEKYGQFCVDFNEVIELDTKSKQDDDLRSWYGEYCVYINNATPKKLSLICGNSQRKSKDELLDTLQTVGPIESFKIAKDRDGNIKLPEQKGLGNYDYDYATNDEVEKICYQLSYMALQIPNFKKKLMDINDELDQETIDDIEGKIIEKCEDQNLLDFEKLSKIGAWDKEKNYPICPLCKEPILAEKFLETAEQDQGREEEDNTQSETVLMHIKALRPGEFNHRTYNLGWGHKHCNTIQSSNTIDETLDDLKRILSNNQLL